jgi:hypothetical protein
MSYFLKNGNTYRVAKKEAMNMTEHLPGGNYVVKYDDMTGQFFLEGIESFEAPKRIYGDCLKNTDRVISTFKDRPATTGVMLTGEKGSGKTLLTKNISIELAKQDVPTIILNAPWCGDKFNTFIQSIEQPAVVLFDEFEKVYDRDDQEKILTLLDGVFPTKKLFLMTCNDKYRVDYHMRNRPGRIYYMIDFKGLSAEFITEYCDENLKNKTYTSKVVQISTLFVEFNFDMLKALVEEMNRYDDTPQEALKLLNVKPEFSNGARYDVEVIHEGKSLTDISPSVWEGNPLSPDGVEFGYDPNPEDDEAKYEYRNFTPQHLLSVDGLKGKFVFEDKGTRIVLTKMEQKQFNWSAF